MRFPWFRINQDVAISEQEAFPSNLLSQGHVPLMKPLTCNHWLEAMQITGMDRGPCGEEGRTRMSQLINAIWLWHTLINVIHWSMDADQAKKAQIAGFFVWGILRERTHFSWKLDYLSDLSGRVHIAAPYLPHIILSLRDQGEIKHSVFLFFFVQLCWVQRGGADGAGSTGPCPPTQPSQRSTWAMVT